MSGTVSTTSSAILTADERTVIVGSLCCLVFFVMIMVLLLIMYRKVPLCCKIGVYRDSHADLEAPPPYHNSRQTLMASSDAEPMRDTGHDNRSSQRGSLFVIGVPSSYYLPPLERPTPRLPSYESVRKKDRQRQIHKMIADRFGLTGPLMAEPPPTYEESIRHSVQSVDILGQDTPPERDVSLPAYEALPRS